METKDYIEIARYTERWARNLHCFRNEDAELLNAFTKSENTTKKPIWSEQFPDLDNEDFAKMWYAGSQIDIFVCYQTATGWYIGTQIEFGKTLGLMVKSLETRHDTTIKHVGNALLCDGIDEMALGFKKINPQFNMSQFFNSARDRKLSLGLPYQEHLASLILQLEAGDKL